MGRTYGYGSIYASGKFRGRRALLSLTTGGPEEAYRKGGFNGDMNAILRPIQRGILQFVGFDMLAPQVHYAPMRASDVQRAAWLEAWARRLDDRLLVEVHVGVDPELTLGEAHDQVERLERELYRRRPEIDEVRTHIEMANRQVEEGARATDEMEQMVRREVQAIVAEMPEVDCPEGISVHRKRDGQEGYYVFVKCNVAPGDLKIAQELARHDSTATTERYTHLISPRLDRAHKLAFDDDK